MRRFLWPIIAVVVIAGGIGIYAATKNKDSSKNIATNTSQSPPRTLAQQTTDACQIFTLANAKTLLGETAVKGEATSSQTSSDDISVSHCNYIQKIPANAPVSALKDIKSASILIRSPKTSAGRQSNQNVFGSGKPAAAQDVTGYGDKAYWNPEFGQFNVLKNDTWIIFSYGVVSTVSTHNLGDAKKLADLVLPKI